MSWPGDKRKFWLAALAAVTLGLVLALLDGAGHWGRSWLLYSLLIGMGLAGILSARRWLTVGPQIERAAIERAAIERAALSAFLLRLGIGVTLALLLPVAGYQDNEATRAGYVFQDAFFRDRQAWNLADLGESLSMAYSPKYTSDQYGGLLLISAGVYRYLSPDAHRPFLILILAAAAAGLGVYFFWKAAREWLGDGAAMAAAWIFALYPESVLLGSSQMREPFVISAIAVAFYALTQMHRSSRSWLAWLAAAGAVLFLIQPPVGLATFGVIFVAWLLDPEQQVSWKRALLFAGILLAGLLVVFTIWANLPSLKGSHPDNIFFSWLQKNFNFQSYLTMMDSRWILKLGKTIGKQWRFPILLAYGVARPVLPAALVVTGGSWVWTVIGILRALGWYALAPFLVYGFFSVFRLPARERRAQLIWISLVVSGWILLSSANAGGDMWDNPRYRTIFLAWEALLAAWAWKWARLHRDAWLGRWILVEGVLVLIFTGWYITREFPGLVQISAWVLILFSLLVVVLIVGGGLVLDWRKRSAERQAASLTSSHPETEG